MASKLDKKGEKKIQAEYTCYGPRCVSSVNGHMVGREYSIAVDCNCEWCPTCCTCNKCIDCGNITRRWQTRCSDCLSLEFKRSRHAASSSSLSSSSSSSSSSAWVDVPLPSITAADPTASSISPSSYDVYTQEPMMPGEVSAKEKKHDKKEKKKMEASTVTTTHELRAVIRCLRSLLCDLHYASGDQNDYLKRNGICPWCYKSLSSDVCFNANCEGDPSKEDQYEEDT